MQWQHVISLPDRFITNAVAASYLTAWQVHHECSGSMLSHGLTGSSRVQWQHVISLPDRSITSAGACHVTAWQVHHECRGSMSCHCLTGPSGVQGQHVMSLRRHASLLCRSRLHTCWLRASLQWHASSLMYWDLLYGHTTRTYIYIDNRHKDIITHLVIW